MTKGVVFTRDELTLFHEALSYGLKRTYSEPEKSRLREIVGRVEDRLLDAGGEAQPILFHGSDARVIAAAAETFCGALEGSFAADSSREKAQRIRELVGRLGGGGSVSWLRRLFRR